MKTTCIRIAMVAGILSIRFSLFSQVITSSLAGTVQVRAEAFNVFNAANLFLGSGSSGTANTVTAGCYAGANNSAGDPSCIAGSTFLHATSAHNPRILQLGMKLVF